MMEADQVLVRGIIKIITLLYSQMSEKIAFA